MIEVEVNLKRLPDQRATVGIINGCAFWLLRWVAANREECTHAALTCSDHPPISGHSSLERPLEAGKSRLDGDKSGQCGTW